MVCIAHMPDALEAKKKGYDVVVSFRRKAWPAVIEGVALVKGANESRGGREVYRVDVQQGDADLLDKNDVYMLATLPGPASMPTCRRS